MSGLGKSNQIQSASISSSKGYSNNEDVNHNININQNSKNDMKQKRPMSVKKVHYWEKHRVLLWLKKHCSQYYQEYAGLFEKHEITGQVLVTLTDQKLIILGISDASHRQEILHHILRLKLTNDKFQLEMLQGHGEGSIADEQY